MTLVEKHDYTKSSKHFKELDNLCFLSKNLYNVTLYHVRQHYFKTKEYLNYNKINKLSNELFPNDYKALPTKVSQQIQKLVDNNFKSFFQHLKVRKQGERINIPKYLHKENGRQIVPYTKQAISFNNRNVPQGYLKLSGTSFLVKTKVNNVQFARIVPKNNIITIEIGYEVQTCKQPDNGRYASIDLGVNNLTTVTSNVFNPFIVNGRPVKSINHYYNKHLAKLSSKQNNKKWTNRMYRITRKRNNKINDYLHKASRYIVNQLVSNNIGTLVIGYNKYWKQDTDLGRVGNQNFVQIPFLNLVNMLKYKCELNGINVIVHEESYTSKCSFKFQDYIPTYNVDGNLFNPSGKRIMRGIFKDKDETLINADVNGSYNIMRKTLLENEVWNENIFSDCIKVCSTPSVYTVKL